MRNETVHRLYKIMSGPRFFDTTFIQMQTRTVYRSYKIIVQSRFSTRSSYKCKVNPCTVHTKSSFSQDFWLDPHTNAKSNCAPFIQGHRYVNIFDTLFIQTQMQNPAMSIQSTSSVTIFWPHSYKSKSKNCSVSRKCTEMYCFAYRKVYWQNQYLDKSTTTLTFVLSIFLPETITNTS